MRNSAARGIFAETPHQPSAKRPSGSSAHDQEAGAEKRLAVPYTGQGKAETIRRLQRHPEKPAYQSGASPGDAGQHGQRDQSRPHENPRRRLNIGTQAPETHHVLRILARRGFLNVLEAAAGARKICFDHKIVGTADFDEMNILIAADGDKLPLSIQRGALNDAKTARTEALWRANFAPEQRAKRRLQDVRPGEEDECRDDIVSAFRLGKTHRLRPASGRLTCKTRQAPRQFIVFPQPAKRRGSRRRFCFRLGHGSTLHNNLGGSAASNRAAPRKTLRFP